MRKILVTGGAGSIGSELVRQLAPAHKVFVLDINETALFDLLEELRLKGLDVVGRVGDVRMPEVFADIEREFGCPDVTYHAAALKHVTPNEWHPVEAVQTNILGTLNAVKFAKRTGSWFVFISTDKVVNAESIMGLTKKIGEKIVKNAGFVSVRFGNVMGSRGSVLPIWQAQIDKGEPLTVTDERMERFMMTIPQAVSLVIEAGDVGKPGEILILDMGEPVNILELAKKVLAESGKDVGIRMIGVRPGETLNERLATEEEIQTMRKEGKFYILNYAKS